MVVASYPPCLSLQGPLCPNALAAGAPAVLEAEAAPDRLPELVDAEVAGGPARAALAAAAAAAALAAGCPESLLDPPRRSRSPAALDRRADFHSLTSQISFCADLGTGAHGCTRVPASETQPELEAPEQTSRSRTDRLNAAAQGNARAGGEQMSTLLWVLIIVLVVLALTGGVGFYRR